MLSLLLICRCRRDNYQRYWWETANFQAQLKFYKYRQCAVIRHTCVIEKIHFANFKPLIFKYFCSLFIIYSLQFRANVKHKLKLARYVFMGYPVKTRESLYWCGRIIFLQLFRHPSTHEFRRIYSFSKLWSRKLRASHLLENIDPRNI